MSRSDEGFIDPLSKELSRRNIEYEIRGSELCYNSIVREEIRRASSFVDSFRNGVATIINDDETEAKIVAWLTKEKKNYRITKTTDGRRFLIILSDSEEGAEKNRKELTRIEKEG
jgi:hypothetical protein